MSFMIFIVLLFSTNVFAVDFPRSPEPQLTPGSLCDSPTYYRYAEKIPYCERKVGYKLKEQVYENYRRLGYSLKRHDKDDYKIDHLIPLCAGGSNHEDNLWPQHKSVYLKTDLLEQRGCEKLQEGKISQKELVELILKVKNNLQLTPSALAKLNAL